MKKIITIANNKGGVSKTTSSYNLAHHIAIKNKKVLLIDLDSQGNLSHTCNSSFIELDNFLNAEVSSVAENLDILPAVNDFDSLEKLVMQKVQYFNFLKNNLIPKLDDYDYVVVDTAPSVNVINTNAYVMSNIVLIPILLDDYSLFGLSNMLEIIAQIKEVNTSLETKIFVNGFSKNRVYNKIAIESLESLNTFSKIYIPQRQSIRDNIARKVPSLDIDEYQELCKVVL